MEDNNPTSCVLVIGDLLLFKVLLPILLCLGGGGVGIQGRFESVTIMITIRTLSLVA
jgi:hypothetical protein